MATSTVCCTQGTYFSSYSHFLTWPAYIPKNGRQHRESYSCQCISQGWPETWTLAQMLLWS